VEENGNIDDIIKIFPLALDKEDEEVKNLALYYLPYSTGFEIECDNQGSTHKNSLFQTIGLLHCDINSHEQRFRITNGIEGLNQLYKICDLLPDTMIPTNSGIHYHVDCTDVWEYLNNKIIDELSEWILSELDTWNYAGNYNPRCCIFSSSRNWVRFKSLTKTMEFRIGEMSFDYKVLFKRITHANQIVKVVKERAYKIPIDELEDNDKKSIIDNRIIKL
jgi:hypothetical protein